MILIPIWICVNERHSVTVPFSIHDVGKCLAVCSTHDGKHGEVFISNKIKFPGSTWTNSYKFAIDERWQVTFDNPRVIAVTNDPAPSFLIRCARSNWIDYDLFSLTADEVTKSFSFSCQWTNAVQFLSRRHRLARIETIDRAERVPTYIQHRPVKPEIRWQLETLYGYSAKAHRWMPEHSRWIAYRFGSAIPLKQGWQSLNKLDFTWQNK